MFSSTGVIPRKKKLLNGGHLGGGDVFIMRNHSATVCTVVL